MCKRKGIQILTICLISRGLLFLIHPVESTSKARLSTLRALSIQYVLQLEDSQLQLQWKWNCNCLCVRLDRQSANACLEFPILQKSGWPAFHHTTVTKIYSLLTELCKRQVLIHVDNSKALLYPMLSCIIWYKHNTA